MKWLKTHKVNQSVNMAKTGSNFNSIDRGMGDKLPILRINQSSALDDLKSLNELKINEENIR